MSKKTTNILYILLLFITLIAISKYADYRKTEDKTISKNGVTTVGLITQRNLPGARTISSISYKYIFYFKNRRIEGGILSDQKYSVDSFFEVKYLPNDPKKNRMDFTKPVLIEKVCDYYKKDCPFQELINN